MLACFRFPWYNKNKATPHKDCASDAPSDFLSDCAKIVQAGSAAMFTAVVPKPFPLGFGLSPVKGFLCEMTENMQADDVQSRQAVFVRCRLNNYVEVAMALDALFQPITKLKGVGAKREEALHRLGLYTPYDLLYHIPRNYLDYSNPLPLSQVQPGEVSVIRVKIAQKLPPQYIRKGMTIFKTVATDEVNDITIVLYNNPYGFQALQPGRWYRMSGKVQGNLLRREISAPHFLPEDSKEMIFPSYPLTSGITSLTLVGLVRQALALLRANPFDWMPEKMRIEHQLMPLPEALQQVHFPDSSATLETARRRLAFDELLQLQLGMLMHKAENHSKSAYPLRHETDLSPFYQQLPFSLTPGQQKAVTEIVADMQGSTPMNRLLQGDVGSGKTAVAAAACYSVVQNQMQCALMAPTEILATQHYHTMEQFLAPLGVTVALLTGSLKAAQKRQIYADLAEGKIQLVVGTHAIFQKDVTFQKLALVITDEQHRFGVAQRALLADKGGCPHKLVMSATPIPRTLALMIYGDLDVSVLKELPSGRLPVQTFAVTGKLRERAYGFIREQLQQTHQGYIVCPMIDDRDESELQAVSSYAETIQSSAFSQYRVGLLHGRMKAAEKDQVMEAFRNHEIDLLVSTTVIEVGVDVPNATILLIENAERFGLSQLHQLRGRVGRGSAQSYCILMTDHVTEECRARMQIMSRTNDGFQIAEADLELRGPGDFFGNMQHGLPPLQVADLSHDTRLLQEVQETAKNLLQEDPTLSKPEHHGLKVEVLRLFQRTGENGRN